MQVPIVNDKDEIIGHKEREEITLEDIVRASGLWIVNSASEVLLVQRAAGKRYYPLTWAVSVAGMVDEGESYATNIVKEAREELGITIGEGDLIPGARQLVHTDSVVYFYQAYFLKRDLSIEDLVLEKKEVEQVRWISVAELAKWYAEKPKDFFPSFQISMGDIEEFAAKQS